MTLTYEDALKIVSEEPETPDRGSRSYLVATALVQCLSADEAARALPSALRSDDTLLKSLAKRVARDVESGIRPAHHVLAEEILQLLLLSAPRRQSACAKVLLPVLGHMQPSIAATFIARILETKNKTTSRQVALWLRDYPSQAELPEHAEFLLRRGDVKALAALVSGASLGWLSEHFVDVERAIQSHGWLISRLYLRFRGEPPATLNRLRTVAPLSFAYVVGKLRIPQPQGMLVNLFSEQSRSSKASLIIWAAGALGDVDALVRIKQIDHQIPYDEIEPDQDTQSTDTSKAGSDGA